MFWATTCLIEQMCAVGSRGVSPILISGEICHASFFGYVLTSSFHFLITFPKPSCQNR